MKENLVRSVNVGLRLSVGLFVLVLFVSAYFDKSIRVLHVFEAVPYLLVPWLCRRNPRMGFSLAFAGGAFWIWSAGFLTTFIRNGFERVVMLIETGGVDRPDILLAVPAFIGTMGMVVFALIGYWRLRSKRWTDLLLFPGMMIAIFLFFISIFAAFAPQYLGMFGGILGN